MGDERKAGDGILVLCRIRPPNEREAGMPVITHVTNGGKTIEINGEEEHKFNFDAVVGMDASQEAVYEAVGAPVLADVLKGYNGTIFAYGQTGSGKTFTMQGPESEDGKLAGIIPRITNNLFDHLLKAPESMEFLCRASLVEIYTEKIRDLFNPGKSDLKVREDRARGIYIEGAEEFYIGSAQEALDLLKMGQSHRAVTSTKMNMESSRSHSVFILTLVQKNNSDGSTKTSKLFLVDLAGSEKVRKTGAEGQTLEEAKTINRSLSALGNVINSLTDGKSTHVPYRDSKLTRILQESLGGNSRTALVINVSPASDNENETTSTCRFGARAKTVKNHAKMNLEKSSAELKMLLARAEKEIERQRIIISNLENEIRVLRGGGVFTGESSVGKSALNLEISEVSEDISAIAEEDDEINGEKEESSEDEIKPMRTRTRSSSIGIELELRALEAQNAKKEEELVLLQDENDTLREKLEDKSAELDRLEEQIKDHADRSRDLEEDVQNMRVELEEAKYRCEEISAELEASLAQIRILKINAATKNESAKEIESQMEPNANIDVNLRQRSPSISAAEEAESLVAAVERGLSETAENGQIPVDLNLTADSSPLEEIEINVPILDFETVSAMDEQQLKISLQTQAEKIKEIMEQREKSQSRKKALESENKALKSRILADMTDYKKWKAAVLVDLRSRIDRNIRLEISLDETKERYESLLKNSHDPNKKRLHFLEQSVRSLSKECQEAKKENETYAAEAKVNEMKIERKVQRINILEMLLNDARDRNEKLRKEIHLAKGSEGSVAPMDFIPPPSAPEENAAPRISMQTAPVSDSYSQSQQSVSSRLAKAQATNNNKIVKPMRGGGGKESDSGSSIFSRIFRGKP